MRKFARVMMCIIFALPMLIGGGFMLSTKNNENYDEANKNSAIKSINPDSMGWGGNSSINELVPSDYPQPSDDIVAPVDPSSDKPELESFDDRVFEADSWTNYVATSFAGGSGTKEDPYQISNAQELVYWGTFADSFSDGKYFILTDDIVLNDGFFESDGTYHDGGDGKLFSWSTITVGKAYIDGQNHTISGLFINAPETDYIGLFKTRANELKNLAVDNVYLNGNKNVAGILVGYRNKEIYLSNLKNLGGHIYSQGGSVAGIAVFPSGSASNSQRILDSENYANITNYAKRTGIYGIISSANEVMNCKNYGDITSVSPQYSAGIVGSDSVLEGFVENCVNYGNITTTGGEDFGVSAIIGINWGRLVSNCKNYGKLSSEGGSFRGAIIGYEYKQNQTITTTIRDCVNYAECNGFSSIAVNGLLELYNCSNYGRITDGHFVGSAIQLNNCKNYGNLIFTSKSHRSGLFIPEIGNSKKCSIINCVFDATVTGVNSSNGVVGYMQPKALLYVRNLKCDVYYTENNAYINMFNEPYATGGELIASDCDFNIEIQGSSGRVMLLADCNAKAELKNIEINAKHSRKNATVLSGNLDANASVTFKNIKIDEVCAQTTTSFKWFSQVKSSNVLVDGVIRTTKVKEGDTLVKEVLQYYGSDFSDYSSAWRTGIITLNSHKATSFYQNVLTVDILKNKKYVLETY